MLESLTIPLEMILLWTLNVKQVWNFDLSDANNTTGGGGELTLEGGICVWGT